MADNVWSRWVRFRCTVQNYIGDEKTVENDLQLDVDANTPNGGDDDNVDISDWGSN